MRKITYTTVGIIVILLFAGIISASQCDDGIDNDLDGDIDFPLDTGCSTADDGSESIVFGYADGCLTYGAALMDAWGDPTYECFHTLCHVCVLVSEAGNYTTTMGHCSGLPACGFGDGVGGGGFDFDPPELEVFSPVEGEVYSDRSVLLNLQTDEDADIYYINNEDDRGRWTRICTDCDFYSRDRTFDEGFNNLTLRATDWNGNVMYYLLSFYLDSRDPKIKKSEPKSGFASGDFWVEFDEQSPADLVLYYGNSDVGFRERAVDFESECVEDRYYECDVGVDLSDYDGQEISYYFNLEDIAGNTDESRMEELMVDYTDPAITLFDVDVDGKYGFFTLDVNEVNFDKITYIDNLDSNPREKNLCTRLPCEKRVSFKDGGHEVVIKVYDEAGNTATANADFFTDSKDPKITKTEPSRGFASGLFEMQFTEANPLEAFLHYGNDVVGMRSAEVDLGGCFEDRGKQTCEISVDLSDYDGQFIGYWFTLEDLVGQEDESRAYELEIDTTFPVIHSITHIIDGDDAEVVVDLTELNLDEVVYINNNDARPRERRFCTRVPCEKDINLNDGQNLIDFQVIDEAGNSVGQSLEIVL